MKILDLGCGNKKILGAIGIDHNSATQADIIHDLDQFPWPFSDNEFDEIICHDILEHLNNIILVMEEIHRITKPGGLVKIRVPHFSGHNAYGDVTHRHFFNSESFNCFVEGSSSFNYYSKAWFKKMHARITFPKLTRFMSFIANKWPVRYERYLAGIFPAANTEIKLKVIKSNQLHKVKNGQ